MSEDMVDNPSDQCENTRTFTGKLATPSISLQRRRELMNQAQLASNWIIDHNIKPHELCFFKRAVEMLTDTR